MDKGYSVNPFAVYSFSGEMKCEFSSVWWIATSQFNVLFGMVKLKGLRHKWPLSKENTELLYLLCKTVWRKKIFKETLYSKQCRTSARMFIIFFVLREIQRSKGMIYFSRTPNKSGHSFDTVNSLSLNIYVLVWL